jgi:hypothetical protein
MSNKDFEGAIQFEKHTLHRMVLERPTDILGGIWFGSPLGYPPFVSLRLPRALGNIVKLCGQEVYVQVIDEGLVADFIRVGMLPNTALE